MRQVFTLIAENINGGISPYFSVVTPFLSSTGGPTACLTFVVAFLVCHCRRYRPLCHRCLHSFTVAADIVVIVVVLHHRHFHLPSSSIIHRHCTCHHRHMCSPLSSKAAVTAVVVIHSMFSIKSCITACRHLRG